MGQEDFPYCVYCDQKTQFIGFDSLENSFVYYCACGKFVLVKEND